MKQCLKVRKFYSLATSQLVCQLYEVKVVLNSEQAIELELKTWEQASCDLWHSERKLRITASVIKEVCHRKASTSCTVFVQKMINIKVLYTPALCYGRAHESDVEPQTQIELSLTHQRIKRRNKVAWRLNAPCHVRK